MTSLPAPLEDIDRALEVVGTDLTAIKALEELAKANERFQHDDEAKKLAIVAKWKTARHGGKVLAQSKEQGLRQARTGPPIGSETYPIPTLDSLGIDKRRADRWRKAWALTPEAFDAHLANIMDADANVDLASLDGEHVEQNTGEYEWFTPVEYIEAARRVMGGIDLDPASSPLANESIRATTFYTKQDDGLIRPWFGRVWMNPPYHDRLIFPFCERLLDHLADGAVEQAVALVNNATETAYFQRMLEVAAALCFPAGRLKFWHPDRPNTAAGLQGQALIYFGPRVQEFRADFMAFGFTVAL